MHMRNSWHGEMVYQHQKTPLIDIDYTYGTAIVLFSCIPKMQFFIIITWATMLSLDPINRAFLFICFVFFFPLCDRAHDLMVREKQTLELRLLPRLGQGLLAFFEQDHARSAPPGKQRNPLELRTSQGPPTN